VGCTDARGYGGRAPQVRCVQEKLYRSQRWLGACYALFFVIIFVVGLRTNVTNVGHAYAAVWTIAHRMMCLTNRRTQRGTFASLVLVFLVLSAAPPLAHVFPRDVRAVDDDAVSTRIGPACIVFGCETKGILF
jgi:hypothetical protein